MAIYLIGRMTEWPTHSGHLRSRKSERPVYGIALPNRPSYLPFEKNWMCAASHSASCVACRAWWKVLLAALMLLFTLVSDLKSGGGAALERRSYADS